MNIICLSTVDWGFLKQTPQEVMAEFAAAGHRVLYIENTGVRAARLSDSRRLWSRFAARVGSRSGFRTVLPNLTIHHPVLFPFPYHRLSTYINAALLARRISGWMRRNDFRDPVLWTYLPTPLALELADRLRPARLVYHCLADFACLSGRPDRTRAAEEALARRADVVFAQGPELADRLRIVRPSVHEFTNGIDVATFLKSQSHDAPPEMLGIPRPIAGYVGGIHRHIDFDLVARVAHSLPDVSFVFVGPIQTDTRRLQHFRNVYFLGEKPARELPCYIRSFDAGIIPYKITDYTRTVYPSKLMQYLILGKPVVSTPLPDLDALLARRPGLFRLAAPNRFAAELRLSLADNQTTVVRMRRSFALTQAWPKKVRRMAEVLAATGA